MEQRVMNYFSLGGSVASIIALLIVLIEKSSDNPQLVIWKIILGLICILFMGGVCVYIYDLLKAVWINSNFTLKKKAALTTLDVSIGLILIAIALDAVLAIVEWRVWLYDIVSFFLSG